MRTYAYVWVNASHFSLGYFVWMLSPIGPASKRACTCAYVCVRARMNVSKWEHMFCESSGRVRLKSYLTIFQPFNVIFAEQMSPREHETSESVRVWSGLSQASEFLFVFSGRDPNMNPVVRVTWWTQEYESEYVSVCNGEIDRVNAVFGFMFSFKTNGNVLPVVRMLLVYLCVCVSVNAKNWAYDFILYSMNTDMISGRTSVALWAWACACFIWESMLPGQNHVSGWNQFQTWFWSVNVFPVSMSQVWMTFFARNQKYLSWNINLSQSIRFEICHKSHSPFI